MLRQIIWIGGRIPTGMTPEKYKSTAVNLAAIVKGELVKFGEDNLMIVGNDESKAKYEIITKEAVKAGYDV